MQQLSDLDLIKKKLIYRSTYRGCKESDFLLSDFAKEKVPAFSEDEVALYQEFIEENDWDIYHWVIGNLTADAKYQSLITQIKDFLQERLSS